MYKTAWRITIVWYIIPLEELPLQELKFSFEPTNPYIKSSIEIVVFVFVLFIVFVCLFGVGFF